MAQFEVRHALRDLDKPTSPYLVRELFVRGSQEVKRTAINALKEKKPKRRKSSERLRAVLDLTNLESS